MTKAPATPPMFELVRRNFALVEQFVVAAPAGWTTDATVAALDEHGGGVSITTAATDNDVGALARTAKPVVLGANKSAQFHSVINFQEAGTNEANVFVGLATQDAGAVLQNNGAGPVAALEGFGFYKVDAGVANWSICYGDGTTLVTQELNADAKFSNGTARVAASSADQYLEISIFPKTATKADVYWNIDGQNVWKVTDYDYSGITDLGETFAVKAGAAQAESIKVRYSALAGNRG